MLYTREDYTPGAAYPLRSEQTGAILREAPPAYYEDFVTYAEGEDESTRLSVGYQAIHPDHGLHRRVVRQSVFRFVVAGRGTVNGKPFGAGDFFYTESMLENTILPDADEPWQIYWFSFGERHTCTARLFRTMAEMDAGHVYHSTRTREIAELLRLTLYSTHAGLDPNLFFGGVMQIIDQQLQGALSEQAQRTVRGSSNMERAKSLIERSVLMQVASEEEQDDSIAGVARAVGLERKYFCRLFSATYGYSPKEYLMQVRLRYGQLYLVDTEYSIQQIASKLGYKDNNSFLRMFRERTGMTPSQYRRAHQKKH